MKKFFNKVKGELDGNQQRPQQQQQGQGQYGSGSAARQPQQQYSQQQPQYGYQQPPGPPPPAGMQAGGAYSQPSGPPPPTTSQQLPTMQAARPGVEDPFAALRRYDTGSLSSRLSHMVYLADYLPFPSLHRRR